MIRLVGPERGRLRRELLGGDAAGRARIEDRLKRFDDAFERANGTHVFDWNDRRFIRATNQIGVLQIPGLTIEILPKTDAHVRDFRPAVDLEAEDVGTTRFNLLQMLRVARDVPLRKWERADLTTHRMSMLEVLMSAFAERLLYELRRGLDHAYVTRQENLSVVKGRIVFSRQVRKNAAAPHRMIVNYDDFLSDTPLNRLLACACHVLLRATALAQTRERLKQILHAFSNVTAISHTALLSQQVVFNRNNERYRQVAGFARLVLEGLSTAMTSGSTPWLSILMPMERLFEAFIGAVIQRHGADLGLDGHRVRLQSKGIRRWVLRDDAGRHRFLLKPDVLVQGPDGETTLILDTKWKLLSGDPDRVAGDLANEDVYQLFTYAKCYNSRLNVLLYPSPSRIEGGYKPLSFVLDGDESKRLVIGFVDLHQRVDRNLSGVISDLARLVDTLPPPSKELVG
jgi:5-methylcytosine-specific restriction enzyme subunit McrC